MVKLFIDLSIVLLSTWSEEKLVEGGNERQGHQQASREVKTSYRGSVFLSRVIWTTGSTLFLSDVLYEWLVSMEHTQGEYD